MEIVEIIAISVIATSAMTLFSYIISEKFKKLYKEPVLLEYLMTSFSFKLSEKQKAILSWLIHYLIGLIFAVVYYLPVWFSLGWYKITLTSGIIFGCIIGIIGIISWHIMFRLSPEHPPVNPKGYFLQLFFAHIIFGITTVGFYGMS